MELRDPWTLFNVSRMISPMNCHRQCNKYPSSMLPKPMKIASFIGAGSWPYWRTILLLKDLQGVHKEVAEAVNQIVTAKSPRDLEAIAQHLRRDLQSGAPVDVEYHEKVIAMAETEALRKRVRTRHRSILKDHLSALEELMKIRGKQSNLKEEPAASERNRQTRNEHQNRDLPKSSTKAEEDSSETARRCSKWRRRKEWKRGKRVSV